MTDQNPTADQPDGAEAMVGSEEFEPTTAEAAVQEQDAVAGQQPAGEAVTGSDAHPDTALAAERLSDLQRLQAEYVNYKRRVDRDRAVVQERAAQSVIEALLPVLDDIHMARQAGDLSEGPFAAIADKIESILGRYGVERLGEAGQEFDPNVHEALMHIEADLPEGASGTTVVQVLQPGYRIGDRLVRAARVSVADPA